MLAIIGGSGLYSFPELRVLERVEVMSSFSETPVVVDKVEFDGEHLLFLPRHGKKHNFPPHKINYRANIEALSLLGATRVLALCTVGGIATNLGPGSFCLVDQVVDYTWGRDHTFYDYFEDDCATHVDFTHPFSASIGNNVRRAAAEIGETLVSGCYGCMQGPRLESAAEIKKLKGDGCDVVGMTLMPEAALAREKNLDYAAIALVVNWAAGLSDTNIDLSDIKNTFACALPRLRALILQTVKLF